jgi:hypothetical protein
MRRFFAKGSFLCVLTICCLGSLEVTSRWLAPISAGARYLNLDGEPIVVLGEDPCPFEPNLVFRQVAAEFDVRVTTSAAGNRVPADEDPKLVFLGDSFTFGQGLADNETFAALYCSALNESCANLGFPGTGTAQQVDILERFLKERHWRPREVKLFMLVMTGTLLGGNDLLDNLRYEEGPRAAHEHAPGQQLARGGLWEQVLAKRKQVLAHSNLARFLYFEFGPRIRTAISPSPPRERLQHALAVTRRHLDRLRELSLRYGFAYRIYLVPPVQDILRGTDDETFLTMRSLAPGAAIHTTAGLFVPSPESYYYPYDGHWNVRGARAVAEFLVEEMRQEQREKRTNQPAPRS